MVKPPDTETPISGDTQHAMMPNTGRSLLRALEDLRDQTDENGMSLQTLCDSLGAKAISGPLFVCALPCCLPFLYGVPQIMALPMLLLAGQIAAGRPSLWLPGRLGERRIRQDMIARIVDQGGKPLRWLEVVSHPRLAALTGDLGRKIIGVFLFLFCLCVLIPLPLTNTVPAFAIVITAFGLIERDGVMAIFGVLLGCLWIAFLIGLALLTLGVGEEWIPVLMESLKSLMAPIKEIVSR